MGIFNRFSKTSTDVATTLNRGVETLPATTSDYAGRIAATGKDLASKATRIYKENPKLVSGIALVAASLLLNRMRSTHK